MRIPVYSCMQCIHVHGVNRRNSSYVHKCTEVHMYRNEVYNNIVIHLETTPAPPVDNRKRSRASCFVSVCALLFRAAPGFYGHHGPQGVSLGCESPPLSIPPKKHTATVTWLGNSSTYTTIHTTTAPFTASRTTGQIIPLTRQSCDSKPAM